MANKKIYSINGEDGCCSISSGVIISSDGKTVAVNNYGQVGATLPVLTDADGPYVNNRQNKRIDTGYAVAEAWNYAYPGDGPKKAERRDGNIMNTSADNLKWVPDLLPYTQNTSYLKRVEWMGRQVTVYKSGKVMAGGLDLPVEDHYHDAATDCDRFLYKPFVKAGGLQLPMDDLMAAASYVGGDPTGMWCPKVLHKDFDMMNYDACNLEWAERSCPEYEDYIDACIETMKAKSAIINAGKDVPDTWFRPPYCPKEYYNWKASGRFGGYHKP